MAKFHVKKTSLSEDGKSLVFKGKVVEGPINKGMLVSIAVTPGNFIKTRIRDIVHFEKKDEDKKVGLVVDFDDDPEALEIVMYLNVSDEDLTCE
jgi:hypothetical protein